MLAVRVAERLEAVAAELVDDRVEGGVRRAVESALLPQALLVEALELAGGG